VGETTKIEERPILFSGPMVRAILAGRKTMTRRVVKPQPDVIHEQIRPEFSFGDNRPLYAESFAKSYCKFGKPGDRLWVRETFSEIPNQKPSGYFTDPKWINRKYWYAADNDKPMWGGKWKSSRYMPRVASRILLEITFIRVERLQEISEADAMAEGFVAGDGHPENGFHTESPYPAVAAFRSLWELLNAERGFGWDQNPWVWVISFRKVTQ